MIPPKIIFEDEYLLVISKPAGMTVNNSDTTKEVETLQDFLGKNFGKYFIPPVNKSLLTALLKREEFEELSDFYKRNGIVHRLDKETSGVIIVAKQLPVFEELQRQFKERIVKKTYIALAHGKVVPEDGEINVPVGRLEFNRKRFGVVAGGREAVTRYKTISNFKYLISNTTNKRNNEIVTLLELYPETGRTHQIRVHLKYLNHPIFADELYAGRKTAREDRKLLSRVFLHAAKISFMHPLTKELVSFESELPEELQGFLNSLT